jgi:hypothetical protein
MKSRDKFNKRTKFRLNAEAVLLNKPLLCMAGFLLLLLILYFCSMHHTIHCWLRRLFNEGRAGTTNYLNLLGMMSLVGTCLGFYYTFKQLRLMEDRIDSYDKFYDALERFDQELEDGKAREFYFYGSTILPGNVGYRRKDRILRFKELIIDINSKFDDKDMGDRIVVLPNADQLTALYGWYYEHFVEGHGVDKDGWKDWVGARALDARDVLENNVSQKIKCYLTDEKSINDIKHAYYLSNGKRVIYAVPLHYTDSGSQPAKGNNGDIKTINPQLAGFSTTNPRIIEGFKQRFFDIIKNINAATKSSKIRGGPGN